MLEDNVHKKYKRAIKRTRVGSTAYEKGRKNTQVTQRLYNMPLTVGS